MCIRLWWEWELRLAAVVGRLEATVGHGPRLTRVCLICKREDDQGWTPTGRSMRTHGLDHPGNEHCIAEYTRRYCQ